MTQMSLLGQNQNNLIDCTEAIPVAPSNTKATTFPAGKSQADLERNVCPFYVVVVFTNADRIFYV